VKKTVVLLLILAIVFVVVKIYAYYPLYNGKIIPTPQKVEYMNEFIVLASSASFTRMVKIIVGTDAMPQMNSVAGSLQSHIYILTGSTPAVVNDMVKLQEHSVYISVGTISDNKYNKEYNNNKFITQNYPGEQGYIIRCVKEGSKDVVYCIGYDAIGAFYAVQSLLQLMYVKDGKLCLRKCVVDDWPVYKLRGVSDWALTKDSLDWMGAYKLNMFFFAYAPVKWDNIDEDMKKAYTDAYEMVKQKPVIELGQMVNPYDLRKYRTGEKIRASDPKDIEKLVKTFTYGINAGVKHLMLCADDLVTMKEREYILDNDEDIQKYGTLEVAQTVLVNTVYQSLKAYQKSEMPKLSIEMYFCPPYYSLGHVDKFMRSPEVGIKYMNYIGKNIDPDVTFVWTGPKVTSKVVSDDDVEKYKLYTLGHKAMLWDNTSDDIFTPWTTKISTQVVEMNPRHGFYYNAFINRVVDRFTILMVADYLWNPKAYNPEKSLVHAVATYAEQDAMPALSSFREVYYKLDDMKVNLSEYADPKKVFTDTESELDKAMDTVSKQVVNNSVAPDLKRRFYGKQKVFLRLFNEKKVVVCDTTKNVELRLFSNVGKGKRTYETKVVISVDSTNLRLTFNCETTTYQPIEKVATIRDAGVYLDDSIELFIDPNKDYKNYYQYAFNFTGTKFDGKERVSNWDGTWDVKTSTYTGYWTAGMVIPLTELGITDGVQGKTIGLNIVRNNPAEWRSVEWSPMKPYSSHTPSLFGEVRFE